MKELLFTMIYYTHVKDNSTTALSFFDLIDTKNSGSPPARKEVLSDLTGLHQNGKAGMQRAEPHRFCPLYRGRRRKVEKIILSILATIAVIATEVIKYHDENKD